MSDRIGQAGYVAGSAARRRLPDLIVAVWRERSIALAVVAVCALIGVAAALTQRPSYTAEASLVVRLGQEYVFQPKVGAAGAGAFPLLQQVVNTETSILGSGELARRVVAKLGVEAIDPSLARAAKPQEAARAAEQALMRKFSVSTTPETPIIQLTYRDENPQNAAKALNAIVDAYVAFRREILVGEAEGGLAAQTRDFETRAKAAAERVQVFLTENRVGDFDAELKALGDLQSRLDSELVEARARRRELEGQAQALGARSRAQPSEIELYSESDSARRLIDLRIERSQLLARYLPDSPPVRDIEARIQEVEAALAQAPAGSIRRGPNPVRQEIERDFFQSDASARAQASRESALDAQRQATMDRLRLLQALEPQYRQLIRERTILEDNARSFRARAEEANAFSELSGERTDTVRVLQAATAPTQARSQRVIIVLGSVLLGLVLGLCAAMLRGITRDRFNSPRDAGARLGLPVLAVTSSHEPLFPALWPRRGAPT